jgi:phage terminase Nu1 subunit (DNA packaging protein)
MNQQLMTQAQFAKHRGVQKSAVSNWKRQGLLVFAEGEGGKMMVDVVRSEARINANVDPTRGRPTTAQAAAPQAAMALEAPSPVPRQTDEMAEERVGLTRASRIEKNLKNARTAGELVPLADYESRAAEYGRLVRERMHAMHGGQAERLAAERDPRIIISVLAQETDEVLGALARRMLARPSAAPVTDLDDAPTVEDELLEEAPTENDGA